MCCVYVEGNDQKKFCFKKIFSRYIYKPFIKPNLTKSIILDNLFNSMQIWRYLHSIQTSQASSKPNALIQLSNQAKRTMHSGRCSSHPFKGYKKHPWNKKKVFQTNRSVKTWFACHFTSLYAINGVPRITMVASAVWHTNKGL